VSEITRFYRQPSPTSELGRHGDLSPGLPADPEALSAIVRGLLVHNFTAKVQGLPFPVERMSHMQTVGAEAILDNVFSLDPGFAAYFEAQRWIDHWVVEYSDGDGWLLTDPQIGRRDLTSDDFQDGLSAWDQCRDGASRPALYGNGELWGWDELRGSLINDVAALSKVEVAGWYWCDRLKVEPLDQPHDELDTSLDILSRLAATAESVEKIKECFDLYPELQPPADAVAR
jgi:hypothetical protein